jgi:zinc transport system substrate-binding protein
LAERVSAISDQLAAYTDVGYYVFHDAFGYFEQHFKLNKLGYFTLSPDRSPGAKTLVQIRSALQDGEAKCVFSEPQFTPAIVASVVRGSDVHQGELDPLATDILNEPGAYFTFLDDLAQRYIHCFSR